MHNPLDFRGRREGILIVGDSVPQEQETLSNPNSDLNPDHPVYNSLIVPIKFYLNNYLNSQGYCMPLEELGTDYFCYINAVKETKIKIKPALNEFTTEIKRPEHKIILSMGSFAFKSVEKIINPNGLIKPSYSIKDLGRIFSERLSDSEFPLHLPILHNIANLKSELTKSFIGDYDFNYISYFQYAGVCLGEFLMKHKEEFEFITPLKEK